MLLTNWGDWYKVLLGGCGGHEIPGGGVMSRVEKRVTQAFL